MPKTASVTAGTPKDTRIGQTVKLDNDLHIRLATFSAKTRQSNQVILVAALRDYLEKHDK